MGVNMLFKNTINTFKKKKVQILAIGIIVALSSFLYTTMFYATQSLKTPLEKFIEVSNQEDFSIDIVDGLTLFDIENLDKKYLSQVETISSLNLGSIKRYNEEIYNTIMNNRIDKYNEENKDYNLELRSIREINFEKDNTSHKISLYKDNKQINKSYIEEGMKPSKDNEIAITRIYAKNNNLEINDTLKINNKEYKVVGYVLFSDNTMPMDLDSFMIDNSKMALGLVTDSEYENVGGQESFYISGEFINDKDDKKLYDTKEDFDFIANITLTENQMRSGGIYTELEGNQMVTIGMSLFISSIAVIIILLITYKIIQSQKSQIGVLKSLGYSNNEILKPYILLLTIISLPMLIIGYFAGIYVSKYMKDLYLMFYLIPDGQIQTNIQVLLVSIIVPFVMIILLSTILIKKMLNKNAIDLMKVSENNKIGKLNNLLNKLLKKAKPKTKFKYSFILSNPSKFIVFFMGILFSSMLIIMSLMMSDFFDKMSLDYYNSVEYKYEAYVDLTKEDIQLEDGQEKFISINNALYSEENINVVGIDYDNKLHNLFNKKDENITKNIKDGAIINSSFATTYDVKKDDVIEVEINNEEYEFKIVEVSKDYNGNKIYIDREKMSEILVDEKDFYTGVYSKEELNQNSYITIIDKEDILEQSETMQLFIKVSIYSMILSAIVIASIILYVLSSMTIEDSYYSISLLKVMGYTKKEINSMIINSYLVYAVISYLISVPLTVISFDYGMKYLASEFNMVIPMNFEWWHIIVGLIIISIIFILGSYSARRKIDKISLQEVLKEYRE